MVITFKRWFARHDREFRYINFLAFLLGLFCLTPIFERSNLGKFVLELLYSIVLLSGALAIAKTRRLEVIGVLAAVAGLVATWLSYAFDTSTTVAVVSYAFNVVFLSFVAVVILLDVVKHEQITMDKVLGAVCVYVLMGIIWGMVYAIIQLGSVDAAFHMAENISASVPSKDRIQMMDSQLMYFSFITLTTVGFGDIVPVHSVARALSCVEAVIGQVYLAVLVAYLVARHVAYARERQDEKRERQRERERENQRKE